MPSSHVSYFYKKELDYTTSPLYIHFHGAITVWPPILRNWRTETFSTLHLGKRRIFSQVRQPAINYVYTGIILTKTQPLAWVCVNVTSFHHCFNAQRVDKCKNCAEDLSLVLLSTFNNLHGHTVTSHKESMAGLLTHRCYIISRRPVQCSLPPSRK